MNSAIISDTRATSGTGRRVAVAAGRVQLNVNLQAVEEEGGENPDLWLYRDRSIAILKRYIKLSVEIGRLPSLLGRDFFRGRVTTYSVSTFEDTVIFVYDVEQSLEKLNKFEQAMVAKIILEEYSQREAARILNCPLRTIEREFPEALDHLSEILLRGGILIPLGGSTARRPKSCQGGEIHERAASCCKHGE